MILECDSTRTGGVKMQLSNEYQNIFFRHAGAEIEKQYSTHFARLNRRPNFSSMGNRPTAKGWPPDLGLRDVILDYAAVKTGN
jgi:hypothetical protein